MSIAGAIPLPVMVMVCGLPATLSVSVMVAKRLPVADGVKVSEMVVVAFGARVTGVAGAVIA